MVKSNPVLGIIGGGQLGSMLSAAAKKLQIKTVVLTDDINAPAKNFCDEIIFSEYGKKDKLLEFAEKVDVITFEFENIPYEVLSLVSKIKKVLPCPEINNIIQNRGKEKTFVNNLGIKSTYWAHIKCKKDILENSELLPGLLKTCTLGYDGKGQVLIKDVKAVKAEFHFTENYILEKMLKLKKEISVIITRYENGKFSIYEPIENIHEDQILKSSKIPANISKKNYEKSQAITTLIAEKLKYVGTMCVEFFIDEKDNLFVNEIAPRVHNSGHLTINAFNISQFENHIRSVLGLEKKELKKIKNAEMVNILGKEINDYKNKKFEENEFFFDYLKIKLKEKRKMGHITTLK